MLVNRIADQVATLMAVSSSSLSGDLGDHLRRATNPRLAIVADETDPMTDSFESRRETESTC